MKGPATVQERIERDRPRASGALECLTLGTSELHDNDIADLVGRAVQDYRLKYRGCPAGGPWLFYDGNPRTVRIKGTPERVDVYCLFCRAMLVNGAKWEHDYTLHVRPHTTICALRSLAGLMTPGAPGTYRLPEEI